MSALFELSVVIWIYNCLRIVIIIINKYPFAVLRFNLLEVDYKNDMYIYITRLVDINRDIMKRLANVMQAEARMSKVQFKDVSNIEKKTLLRNFTRQLNLKIPYLEKSAVSPEMSDNKMTCLRHEISSLMSILFVIKI